MPEDVQTTEAAESSTAADAPGRAEAERISVPTDPEAYAEWRQTGKLPERPSKKDASAPSKSADEESEKAAPVSDTGRQRQAKRDNAETRKEELNREIRDLLSRRDELKREVNGKADVKADSSPAPKPEPPKRPVRPKQSDFDDWAKLEEAQDKYIDDVVNYTVSERLEQESRKQQKAALNRHFEERLTEAESRYGAESIPQITGAVETVIRDQAIPPDIKVAIGRSPVVVDAMYALASDRKDFEAFIDLAKKDPLEALRKWYTVEALTHEELKKPRAEKAANGTPSRGADGKFVPEKPVRTREAPEPPTELAGNSSPAADERARAADTGDFRSFRNDGNRREMARRRGL